MKFLIVILIAIVGIVSALPQGPLETLTKEKPFVCGGGTFVPSPKVLEGIGKCKKENPNCEFFCVARILDLLEDSGLPTRASYARFTKNTFPDNLQELSLKHFNDCMEKHGPKLDLNDKTCAEANLLNDCTWSLQPKLVC